VIAVTGRFVIPIRMVRGRHHKIYTLAKRGRRALQDWVKSPPVKLASNAAVAKNPPGL
jgi:hypothetical protein